MDMAVGVIVGGAFTAIVTSLNQDIMTPILAIFGGTDFSNLYVKLGSGDTAPVLMYGNFITAVINFLITAFVIFCLVKFINKLGDTLHHKEEAPAAPTTPASSVERTTNDTAHAAKTTSMSTIRFMVSHDSKSKLRQVKPSRDKCHYRHFSMSGTMFAANTESKTSIWGLSLN